MVLLGATRTDDGKELLFARQSIVIHCKAYGLQAIDMVHINYTGLSTWKHLKTVLYEETLENIWKLYCMKKLHL